LGGGGTAGVIFVPHHRFGFAHGQAARDHVPCHAALRVVVGQRDERTRVPHAERARREIVAHFRRQFQETHVVRDGRAIFADAFRDRFLRQMEFVGQAAIRLRFFDGIQILALNVFDQRDFEHLVVRDLAMDDGDFEETGALRGAPPALAGDDFGAAADGAHEDSAE
jgi:hypothetical protein